MWEESLVADLILLLNRNGFLTDEIDRWDWKLATDYRYNSKDGYNQIALLKGKEQPVNKVWTDQVWLSRAPQKINSFVWKALLDRLATRTNLKKRNILFPQESTACRLCDANLEENADHLFISCDLAKVIWIKIQSWLDICVNWSGILAEDIWKFNNSLPAKSKDSLRIIWHGTLWFIWKTRNKLIFFWRKMECCRNL